MVRLLKILLFVVLSVSLSHPLPATEQPELPPGLEQGWYARIETVKGAILARLLADQAPRSVATFSALAQGRLEWTDPETGEKRKEPYYDGLPITMVSAGRMFVAGDRSPLGQGTPKLFVPQEGTGPVRFSGGLRLGMIRSAGRNSGVLFFVTASAIPQMDDLAPCFGEVVRGKEVVFQISQVKAHPNGEPLDPIVIDRIQILPVGDPPPLPEPQPYAPKRAKPRMKRGALKP